MVIYEDEDLLVINKPYGLLTIPDGYNPSLPSVKFLLESEYGKLWIVHRLDKETSGVLLLARNAKTHKSLNSQFETRKIKKTYHAIIRGNPPWSRILISIPLRINGDRKHRTVPDYYNGKKAETLLNILSSSEEFSFVEAFPLTGYTHQIRSHLASIGFPIHGDRLYGPIFQQINNHTLYLHARSINFTHPRTLKLITFTAPYPAYWKPYLKIFNLFDTENMEQ